MRVKKRKRDFFSRIHYSLFSSVCRRRSKSLARWRSLATREEWGHVVNVNYSRGVLRRHLRASRCQACSEPVEGTVAGFSSREFHTSIRHHPVRGARNLHTGRLQSAQRGRAATAPTNRVRPSNSANRRLNVLPSEVHGGTVALHECSAREGILRGCILRVLCAAKPQHLVFLTSFLRDML